MSAPTEAGGPLVFNPFDPGFRVDPYPTCRRLREETPWHESPLGMVVLTRYDDVVGLLRHPAASSEGDGEGVDGAGEAPPAADPALEGIRPFLFRDPPDHTRLRGLVQKAFTPKVVEGLRPRVQELVDGLVEPALEQGSIEAVADLAYPLPVRVISDMLGVPHDDHEMFQEWSKVLAKTLDPDFGPIPADEAARRSAAGTAFVEYFRGLIARRRTDPRDDLLSALVHAEEEGDKLSEGELLSTLILLLVAGHETTVNLIGNGLLALARDGAAQQQWRADPGLDRTAVEELLRYDPPVQLTARSATADIELPSGTLEQGRFAITLIGGANRDPEQFEAPDALDLARARNPHVAFSFGIHFCLGAPLARMEGQIAIGTLLRRTRELGLAVEVPEYKENLVLRGLERLPLAVTPA